MPSSISDYKIKTHNSENIFRPENETNILRNAQLKLQLPGLPSKFTVCPPNRPLLKPRSEDSLLDFNHNCPCPYCQLRVKANRNLVDSEDDCPLCILKRNRGRESFSCVVCKSRHPYNCVSVGNLSQTCCYSSESVGDGHCDKNGNYKLNLKCKDHCCSNKNEVFKEYNRKVAQDIFSLLPNQKVVKFNSAEMLYGSGSFPLDSIAQHALNRMYDLIC